MTKLQGDLSKSKANVKTLKKDFKAYVKALKALVDRTNEEGRFPISKLLEIRRPQASAFFIFYLCHAAN